jgi:type IV secretory pathway VirB4 component
MHTGDGKRVHDFLTEEEWTGSFIVLGTTGSGKITLIKYVHTVCELSKLFYVVIFRGKITT